MKATATSGRLTSALSYVGRLAIHSPRALGDVARSVGGLVLDFQFEESSPIPALPPALLRALRRHDVLLPARRLLGPGNQSYEGLVHLTSLARALDAKTIFEIGTYNGLTALALASNLPSSGVHTLDLYPDEEPALPLQQWDHVSLKAADSRVYERRAEAERIVQHYGDSAAFDFSPFRRRCDLVYVDGSHSAEYVANDTRAAFDIVSRAGAIVWDDYWRQIPEVAAFLHGLQQQAPLYRLPGSRLVVWLSDGALAHLSEPAPDAEAEAAV